MANTSTVLVNGSVSDNVTVNRAGPRGCRSNGAASVHRPRLVFETRRPEHRAWEQWAADTGPITLDIPEVGQVERHFTITEFVFIAQRR